jgi:S1-C subfamily serine protease
MLALGLLLGFTLGLVAASSVIKAALSPAPLYDEKVVTSLFESASPAVVEISVVRGGRGLPRTTAGSGFLIDREGHILTNYHVVDGGDEITVKLADERILQASKLGNSPADDLALLQVNASEVADIEPLPLADSDGVKPGQMAIAIGSPFRNFNSVSVGVVSGTGRGPTSSLRRPIPNMIQTDAPLNPGNSGGPLLNASGEVIGVNSAVRTGNTQSLLGEYRIGFAVPSNTVKELIPDLIKSQQVRRPWLGIGGNPLTQEQADMLGVSQGITVSQIFPGSPAQEVGLVPFNDITLRGDVIIAVDGEEVTSVEDMVTYFNTHKPGDRVKLSILRNKRPIEIEVILAEWPDT